MKFLASAFAALLLVWTAARAETPIRIVAAENFYGDLAEQLAGQFGSVTSILANPDEDPHLFEATPSVARAIAGARIVILNGADYDPWMEKLLHSAASEQRRAITVADLVSFRAGGNPHLWYDPSTMPALAQALVTELTAADPAHAADYRERLERYRASLQPLDAKVTALRARFAGTPVTATEPVFGLMASALGLTMRNERFQRAVMNDTEPSAADTAAFETDLRRRRVRLLIYNSQATDSASQRLLAIAHEADVPAVGVTETEPGGKSYQDWMLGQLDAVERALAGKGS